MTNTNNDQTRETDALNTYLAQGVAGVAISPLNTQTSPATIADVMDAGMKVAICNNALDAFPGAVASYSADNYSFCHQTGEAAVKFIQENYGADETINIGVIQFKTQIPEQSADRVDGFFAALDEAGINYEIIADQDAWLQDMAVETAGDMISANPDLDIIYAANDGGTVGSVMAVENAGKAGEIFVFGTDGSEQIVDLLKTTPTSCRPSPLRTPSRSATPPWRPWSTPSRAPPLRARARPTSSPASPWCGAIRRAWTPTWLTSRA